MGGGGFRPQMPTAMVVFLLVTCAATLTMAQENVGNETAMEERESACRNRYRPFKDGFDSEEQTQESFRGLFSFVVVVFATFPFAFVFPQYLHLPLVNGWLVGGILCGPYVLDLVTEKTLEVWGDHIAYPCYTFIALVAGSILYIPDMRPFFPTLVQQVLPITVSCIVVIGLTVALLSDHIGGFISEQGITGSCKVTISIIFGVFMVTGSTDQIVAIAHELQPQGDIVVLVVGVTVAKDVLAIVLFSIVKAFLNVACGEGFGMLDFPLIVCEIVTWGIGGLLLGRTNVAVLRTDLSLFAHSALVIGLAWSVFELDAWLLVYSRCQGNTFDCQSLLVALIAGSVVANDETVRQRQKDVLSFCSTPFLLVFFCYVGANLKLSAIVDQLSLGSLLMVLRTLCLYLFSVLPARYWSHLPPELANNLWLCYIPQGGLTLALADSVAEDFRDSWGRDFEACVVFVVLVTDLLGPVMVKFGLQRSGALSSSIVLPQSDRFSSLADRPRPPTRALSQEAQDLLEDERHRRLLRSSSLKKKGTLDSTENGSVASFEIMGNIETANV
jgi:hypothetical protein